MASRIELLTRLSGIFLAAGLAALCIAVWMYVSFHLHDYLVLMQKARARYKGERPHPRMPETDEAVPEKHTVQNPSDILRAEEKAEKQAKEKAKETVTAAAQPKAEPAVEEKPEGKEKKTETKAGTEPKSATHAAGTPAQTAQPERKAVKEPETAGGNARETAPRKVPAEAEEPAPAKEESAPAGPLAQTPEKQTFRLTRHVLITSGAVPASENG